MTLTSPTEVNKPRPFPPSRGDSPSASTQNLLSSLDKSWKWIWWYDDTHDNPWWYHDNTTIWRWYQTRLRLLSVAICCLLFHISNLWLFLCLQFHVIWLNDSICAVLLPTSKQACSEVCALHNLCANIIASLVLCGHMWASTFSEVNIYCTRTRWRNCTQISPTTSKTWGKQSLMPSMFRASPWEVIPLEAQWGLLGVAGNSNPDVDQQRDLSDSRGWLRPLILAGVTSEFQQHIRRYNYVSLNCTRLAIC